MATASSHVIPRSSLQSPKHHHHRRRLSLDFMSALAEAAPRGNRPRMEIKIDRHFTSKVYTSGSTVSGHVLIQSTRPVSFDDVEIFFMGIAHTRVDFVQQYATHSTRPFLKLRMPVRESDLPDPRVFEAGRTYALPFHFVVPHQLTIGACNHKCQNPLVQDQHLRLPPSMGVWDDNDQAPDMAHIEYAIRAHATRKNGPDGAAAKVLEGHQILKVMPSMPEDAPLDVTDKDERYQLSKSKTIRKNLMTTKVGKLSVKSTQPSAVVLAADAYSMSGSSLRLNLEFNPTSVDTAPPKINSITAKLQSTTFYASVPAEQLPNMGCRDTYRINPTLTYSTHNAISLPALDKVNWEKQSSVSTRRGSGSSVSSPDDYTSESDSPHSGHQQSSKKNKKCPIKHIATLDLPFTLPVQNHKFFLPTFHSCLISRTYVLHVTLSAGPLNTNISLSLPLQIAVESVNDPQVDDGLPSFESAMAQAEEHEADSYLQPRLMRVPSARYQGNSILPGYAEISRQPVAVA